MPIPQLSEQDKAEITYLEEAMWREETRFNLTFQQARFAPDFFEFGRSAASTADNSSSLLRHERSARYCRWKM
jgi:hypothetical protein